MVFLGHLGHCGFRENTFRLECIPMWALKIDQHFYVDDFTSRENREIHGDVYTDVC